MTNYKRQRFLSTPRGRVLLSNESESDGLTAGRAGMEAVVREVKAPGSPERASVSEVRSLAKAQEQSPSRPGRVCGRPGLGTTPLRPGAGRAGLLRKALRQLPPGKFRGTPLPHSKAQDSVWSSCPKAVLRRSTAVSGPAQTAVGELKRSHPQRQRHKDTALKPLEKPQPFPASRSSGSSLPNRGPLAARA